MTRQKIIDRIASDILGIATPETRNADALDFHDLSVWSIREALTAAYQAGSSAADKDLVAALVLARTVLRSVYGPEPQGPLDINSPHHTIRVINAALTAANNTAPDG